MSSPKLWIYKVCCNHECGKAHGFIPDNARELKDDALAGIYWECECKSTQFIPASKIEHYMNLGLLYKLFYEGKITQEEYKSEMKQFLESMPCFPSF